MSTVGHQKLIDKLRRSYKDVFEKSAQSICLYLSDMEKTCNDKFAKLLEYESIEQWEEVEEDFQTAFVLEGSQQMLNTAYQKAMEDYVASFITVTWRKKDGDSIKTEVILVPVPFEEHVLALFYITEKDLRKVYV